MPPKRAGPDGMKKTVRTTTTTADSAAGKKIVKKVQTITTTKAPAQRKKPSTAKATTIVQTAKKQTSQASSQWNLPQNLAAPNPSPAPFPGFTAQTSFTFSDPNRPGTILPTPPPSVNPFVYNSGYGSYTAPKPAESQATPATIEGSNGKPVASTGNAKNFVWLIYYRSGHQRSADLIGVYTTEKRALKNAKALIDRETGGAATRVMNGVAFIDNSADLEAVGEEGTIYEAKYGNGGKNVVSFTKIRLNEDYC